MREVLDTLSGNRRIVAELFFFGNETTNSIADALNVTNAAVAGILFRLRRTRPTLNALRPKLSPNGWRPCPARPQRPRLPQTATTRSDPGMPHPPHKTCQWPLWGDEPPTHEYCGKPVVSERPYCQAHCARAYRFTGDAPREPARWAGRIPTMTLAHDEELAALERVA